jgi:two-component system NtrC family sensor kinase
MEILIIDDEPLVAKTLGRLLQPHSVQIIESSTALETVCEGGFDLIFCDLMMPELNGQQLYNAVCEKKPELAKKFVFITGGAFSGDSESFLAQSTIRVLYKPFDRGALKTIIEAAEATQNAPQA